MVELKDKVLALKVIKRKGICSKRSKRRSKNRESVVIKCQY